MFDCAVGVSASIEVKEFEKIPRKNSMFGIELAVSIMDGPELSEHRRKELALDSAADG